MIEFYIKILVIALLAGLAFKYMMVLQKRKQDKADHQLGWTMKLIEIRDKKYKENNGQVR